VRRGPAWPSVRYFSSHPSCTTRTPGVEAQSIE
jgi:hypothetical protein